jgi:diaminopimelate decarboxylase
MNNKKISHSLHIKDNHLFMEGCDVTKLAEEFGTPLFVVSESHLKHNLGRYQQTFSSHWPEGRARIMPAIKANNVITVRKILSAAGTGCDVFGPGELEGALRGDVPPQAISVNGSIKDEDVIKKAIDVGARIVLDSPRELKLCNEIAGDLNKTARVMIRLKPHMKDLETKSDFVPELDIRYLTQIIKYGIPTSEVLEMGPLITRMNNVEPVGIHIHMGRHSKKLEVWQAWVEACITLTKELSQSMGGWQPAEIDLGGGFPSDSDTDTDLAVKGYPGPTLDEYAEAITSTLRTAMQSNGLKTEGLLIEVEPGRGLHTDTGIHISTVRNLKHETTTMDHHWAEIDTSEVFLGVHGLNLEMPPFEFKVANKADTDPVMKSDIVGSTCNAEILFFQVDVPRLEIGDIIALLNTGAYIEPMAANFNALPRPGMVLVNSDNAEMIKRHETVEDVFARDIIPQRFQNQARLKDD